MYIYRIVSNAASAHYISGRLKVQRLPGDDFAPGTQEAVVTDSLLSAPIEMQPGRAYSWALTVDGHLMYSGACAPEPGDGVPVNFGELLGLQGEADAALVSGPAPVRYLPGASGHAVGMLLTATPGDDGDFSTWNGDIGEGPYYPLAVVAHSESGLCFVGGRFAQNKLRVDTEDGYFANLDGAVQTEARKMSPLVIDPNL